MTTHANLSDTIEAFLHEHADEIFVGIEPPWSFLWWRFWHAVQEVEVREKLRRWSAERRG